MNNNGISTCKQTFELFMVGLNIFYLGRMYEEKDWVQLKV